MLFDKEKKKLKIYINNYYRITILSILLLVSYFFKKGGQSIYI